MPVYRSLEGELITPSQFDALSKKEAEGESFGFEPVSGGPGPFREFQPVDFGKPLSVLIRRIYTGRFPEEHMFSDRKPMLISTSVKDITTTSAGTRALNVLKNDVRPRSVFNGPGAAEQGTNLVYYSPAVASPFITVGMTMIFQDFDNDLFDRLSKLFSASAGVPVFMPAATYLIAASTVVKLAGEVGSQILNGHPVLDENIQLDFSFGGGPLPAPGFWILSSGTLDASKYQYDPTKGLVRKSDATPYNGADPVVVVTIDGTPVDGVSNFTPLLASSSVLGRFFNQKENSEVAMDTILDAVKLANDLTFRKKAEETEARLAKLSSGDPKRKNLEDALKAFNQNIGEARLQLPAGVTVP
jgi:hypothetical protein